MKRKIFRLLVCLVLICSLLINLSPIRVHAVDPVSASMLTIGAAACMMLMAAGVVINPQTQEQLEGIGQSFSTYMYQWGTSAEKLDQVEELFNNLTVIEGGGGDDSSGDDEDESPNERKFEILDAVMVGIGSWIVGMVAADALTYEEETEAPEGYAYYNDVLLPVLPSDLDYDQFPYLFINKPSAYTYYVLIACDKQCDYGHGTGFSGDVPYSFVEYHATRNSGGTYNNWSFYQEYTDLIGNRGYNGIIWSNYDVYYHYVNSGAEGITCAGSEPVYVTSETVTIAPDAYVGDTPDQIKNGEINADEIAITSPLVYGNILTSGDTLADIQAAAQGLVTDPATYPQYIQNITYNQTINPDPGVTPDPGGSEDPDPGETEDPEVNPDPDPEVSTDIGDYTMSLDDFFPFCIPFDIFEFLNLLCAEPEAPRFVFTFNFGEYLGKHELVLDLSTWDSTAELLRKLELMLFILGLAMATRNYYIRG